MEKQGSANGRALSKRKPGSIRGKKRDESTFLKENAALIKQLIDAKIEFFKSESLEIKFSPLAFLPKDAFEPKSETQQEDTDELLFYSAPPRG